MNTDKRVSITGRSSRYIEPDRWVSDNTYYPGATWPPKKRKFKKVAHIPLHSQERARQKKREAHEYEVQQLQEISIARYAQGQQLCETDIAFIEWARGI